MLLIQSFIAKTLNMLPKQIDSIMESKAIAYLNKLCEDYVIRSKISVKEDTPSESGEMGKFECLVLRSTKKVIEGSSVIVINPKTSVGCKAVTLLHECGHHYHISRYNDPSEASAWAWADNVIMSSPLWVRYGIRKHWNYKRNITLPFMSANEAYVQFTKEASA